MPDSRLDEGSDAESDPDSQTLADSDQTAADSDQTASDLDETSSESDQAASDEDQAASDRDLAGGGDRGVHNASAEIRVEGTKERLRSGTKRAQGGTSRDSVATIRDRAAEARDRAADRRDRELEARDAEWSSGPTAGTSSKGNASRARVAADRRRAADARKRAAADRKQAAEDREHAARYRVEAREEHAALQRQVAISETDSLTGARARAPGLADLEVEINRVQRSTGELAVAYVDVVGLKAVNDTRGHAAGDALLEDTVRLIREHLRSYDVVIRIGGDEFVCVLSGATIEDARQRFDGIQADATASGLGIKFGIAALRPGDRPSDLIERADSELPSPRTPIDQPSAPASRPSPPGGQPRILITDDRPEMAVIVEDAMAGRYACEFAGNIKEARKMLAGNDFELLLCDLHSGGESAMALAMETVRGRLETAVILIAEEDDPEAAGRAFKLGVYGYVVRPLPGQLLITTMNALRRRELEISHRELSQNLEKRRQTIIDMAPIAIYAKDTRGRYVVANAMAEGIGGVGRGELIGRTDEALLPHEEARNYAASDRQVLERGAVVEREDRFELEGVAKTFKTIRFPIQDEAGRTVAVGGVATDITAERESIEALKLSREETVERLARAIDRHDASTGQHVHRLAALTAFLGARLGLEPDRVALLASAAPMHDVGKIGTPEAILRKAGPLSSEERSVMEQHTLIGHEMLADSSSELLRLAATVALTHHERYDGSGYPHGLAGAEIPLEGRIAAVADVFDALLSDRAYRPALPQSEAVALIEAGRGSQFDPEIVDLLLEHLDEALALREEIR